MLTRKHVSDDDDGNDDAQAIFDDTRCTRHALTAVMLLAIDSSKCSPSRELRVDNQKTSQYKCTAMKEACSVYR